ncbi:uncharacterized protein LOC125845563 [Solanum stenotomum]|uniref:uncharacterized protein LOC125845563 n=1 Tax=Solanum stenotomum TaxID=172797 RepID=UPI0020D025CD|nr:uncharacterized protein LOC125845563 [Solanum stenotomum]
MSSNIPRLDVTRKQLPFFVLNKLHDMSKQADELPLLLLVNDSIIFFVDLPNMISESFKNTKDSIKHLLHAVHIASCHGQHPKKNLKYDIKRNKVMPNATELSQAGVSFVKAGLHDKLGDKTSLFDSIKFENGLMTIPCFQVYDGTETILRNLIAYEQQSSDVQYKYFTDFAAFMDHLIDSEKDVSLLRQKGIIENWMGEDKEMASLFNKNGHGITTYSDFYYKTNA